MLDRSALTLKSVAGQSPTVSLIVAQGVNRAIGKDNAMPWHIPDDLRYFKQVTLGKPVVMGRKTFESIGRPLPGRKNIVVSRQCAWQADGVCKADSLAAGLHTAVAELSPDQLEVMVIGGAEIYRQAMPLADRLYITQVFEEFEGDAFFPAYSASEWKKVSVNHDVISSGRRMTDQGLAYEFQVFDRI